MLFMVEKSIRGGMCQAIYKYAKANNKYMKNYNANQKESYLEYLDANNLCKWSISKQLPVNGFERMDDLSNFNEDFIKNYDENSDKGYFLEVDIDYPKHYLNYIVTYHFYLNEKKLVKQKNLFVVQKM